MSRVYNSKGAKKGDIVILDDFSFHTVIFTICNWAWIKEYQI